MNRRSFWLVVAFSALAVRSLAHAQNLESDLNTALVGKQMYPRGFSADAVTRWHWDDTANTFVLTEPSLRTLGVLTVRSVTLKGTSLLIRGETHTLVLDNESALKITPVTYKAEMLVDLPKEAAALSSATLLARLFFPNAGSEIAALPAAYKGRLPHRSSVGEAAKSGAEKPETCECAVPPDVASCGNAELPGRLKGMKPPRLMSSAEPEFPEEAREKRMGGSVLVGITVDAEGHPVDPWIEVPAGYGLDAAAARAVVRYRFAPATCHDTAIPTHLTIEVNFAITSR